MKTHYSFRTGFFAILIAVVLPLGCQNSTGDLVGPSDTELSPSLDRAFAPGGATENQPDQDARSLRDDEHPTNHGSYHHEKKSVTRVVTPARGGVLKLNHSKLVLFPGSVSQTVSVSWMMSDDEPQGLKGALPRIYQFSPDGLVFHTPGKAFISFSDAGLGRKNPHSYHFYYFNESTGKWERQKTQVNIFLKQFVVTMRHFSRYAFGR